MVSGTTISRIIAFTAPGVQTGVIPESELKEAIALLRKAAKGTLEPKQCRPILEDAGQVAKRLGCCRKTVLRMAKKGILVPVYLTPGSPKGLRFRDTDVDRLVEGRIEQ